MEYSKCSLGKRCVVKTDDNYVFRKFTLLCAISNSKCVGAILYKEGGMTKERFVEFLDANIFNKYKNHLMGCEYTAIKLNLYLLLTWALLIFAALKVNSLLLLCSRY